MFLLYIWVTTHFLNDKLIVFDLKCWRFRWVNNNSKTNFI